MEMTSLGCSDGCFNPEMSQTGFIDSSTRHPTHVMNLYRATTTILNPTINPSTNPYHGHDDPPSPLIDGIIARVHLNRLSCTDNARAGDNTKEIEKKISKKREKKEAKVGEITVVSRCLKCMDVVQTWC